MIRTATALVVLAATLLPSAALACGMYIPDDDDGVLEELFAAVDAAKNKVEAAEVVETVPIVAVEAVVPVEVATAAQNIAERMIPAVVDVKPNS